LTKKDNRDFLRLMAHDAKEVNPDKLGRITLPAYLTELAQLNKQVVVVGSYDYIEIWDQTKYHQYLDKLEQEAETIAERLETDVN
jgi:MraZ protein